MNQKIVHDLVNELAIYAYRLRVSQADVPYAIQPGARVASTKKLSLYVDDLTIDGDLVNPGQDMTIVARAIHLTGVTSIDAGGADPLHAFAPGSLPLQAATGFGAAGAPGADASAAQPSGHVTLVAGLMDAAGQLPGAAGSASSLAGWVEGVLSTKEFRAEATAAVTGLPVAFKVSTAFLSNTAVLDVEGATASGADQFSITRAAVVPGNGGHDVDVTFRSLTLAGTVSLTWDSVLFLEGAPLTSTPFVATVRLRLAADASVVGLRATVTGSPQLTLGDAGQSAMQIAADVASIGTGLMSSFAQHLGPALARAVAAAAPSAGLLVSAQGGPGGRGQDGQGGIAGQPGTSGIVTAGNRGLLDNGILIEYPGGAEGTAGSSGGAAGNAGHSTPGAPGGRITVAVGAAVGVHVVATATGGAGGDAAVPGAIGPGGPGGAGAIIEAQIAGQPADQVQECEAPRGADGAPGAAPTYAGAIAADGADGPLTLNGTPLTVPVATSGSTDDALAAAVPLALLLVSDQGNAVDHLDARTAADLVPVVARYRWLAGVTAPFAAGDDPSHGAFTAADIAVRKALHASATLELARIGQGLDYYGDVVSWVPVISMAALQSRVTSLFALGKIIEDTYLAYQQQGASTETRLSVLDDQRQHLLAKIAADQAAIAALDTQVNDAAAQVSASLKPVIDQQQRLADDEFEFKAEFAGYVTEQTFCSFLGVLEAVVGIVVCAAEVVIGVGEIGALTEAASIAAVAGSIVKVIKAVDAEINAIKKAVASVAALTANNPDAAKLVVDEQKFDDFIGQYLGKFPAADALADAVHQYFALIQAHNKLTLAYVGLFLRRARLQAVVARSQGTVEALAAARAAVAAGAPLPEEAPLLATAYWDLKADLLRELYEFNRAYAYWSLIDRPFLASDSTVADLASVYAGWTKDIDTFLEQSGPVQPFEEQLDITRANFPEAFALLATTRTLNVMLDLRAIAPTSFAAMTHIVATKVAVALPDIHPASGAVLVTLTHSGLSQQNSGLDLSVPANVHTFNHARRTIPYKIDYGNPANSAGGLIGDSDQGFPGLSPFTLWEISFAAPGNEWLDVTQITRVRLTFSGTFLLGGGIDAAV
jgi:hypothetical protein